jgi:hypothetical protein
MWANIATFIKHMRVEFSRLPSFLGGHSSDAGLILNASQQSHEPVHIPLAAVRVSIQHSASLA